MTFTGMMRHTSVRIYRRRAILRLRTQNTLLRWRIAPGCGWLINDFLRKLRIRRLGAETQRQTRTFSRPSTQAARSAGALTMPSYLNPWRNPDISSSYTIVLVIIELTAALVRHSRNAIHYVTHFGFLKTRRFKKTHACQKKTRVLLYTVRKKIQMLDRLRKEFDGINLFQEEN